MGFLDFFKRGRGRQSTEQPSTSTESTSMINCPLCKAPNPLSNRFCSSCGKPLAQDIRNAGSAREAAAQTAQKGQWLCTECGTLNPVYLSFCRICGSEEKKSSDSTQLLHYLKQVNAINGIDQTFPVVIMLHEIGKPVQKIQVNIRGYQNSNDVLKVLEKQGSLSAQTDSYQFLDWPHVKDNWGPDYQTVPAFLCEMTQREFTLQML